MKNIIFSNNLVSYFRLVFAAAGIDPVSPVVLPVLLSIELARFILRINSPFSSLFDEDPLLLMMPFADCSDLESIFLEIVKLYYDIGVFPEDQVIICFVSLIIRMEFSSTVKDNLALTY